jgi:hypothetical protein
MRLGICLLLGSGVASLAIGAAAILDTIAERGLPAALAGLQRIGTQDLVRVAGPSAMLAWIACFPVYGLGVRFPGHISKLLSTGLAALTLTGYLSLIAWLASGEFVVPPPGLILALAVAGLASAYACGFVVHLLFARRALG